MKTIYRHRVMLSLFIAIGVYGFAWQQMEEVEPVSQAQVEPETSPDEFSQDDILNIDLPDFSQYIRTNERKLAFFEFLRPVVELQNQKVLAERDRVLAMQKTLQSGETLSEKQRKQLERLAKRYIVTTSKRSDQEVLNYLLRRVDMVPVSLALSQSASESGWGMSRFAMDGNNLFGQWCFREGCGIVPRNRPEGASHEVAAFDSPVESVASYIHNLNTNFAYLDFRSQRAQMRAQNQSLSGLALVYSLSRYSTRGEEYIEELRAMILYNDLDRFDT